MSSRKQIFITGLVKINFRHIAKEILYHRIQSIIINDKSCTKLLRRFVEQREIIKVYIFFVMGDNLTLVKANYLDFCTYTIHYNILQ